MGSRERHAEQLEIEIARLTAELAALRAERDGLLKIVERLPKTADGVPVAEGCGVYFFDPHLQQYCSTGVCIDQGGWATRTTLLVSDCYSTREAAEAARKETP